MKAYINKIRISPNKLRLVVDAVRKGKSLDHMLKMLMFIHKRGAPVVSKAIHSAIVNAEHNSNINRSSLILSEIFVGEGKITKKIEVKGRGKTGRIKSRYSNLTVLLKEVKDGSES